MRGIHLQSSSPAGERKKGQELFFKGCLPRRRRRVVRRVGVDALIGARWKTILVVASTGGWRGNVIVHLIVRIIAGGAIFMRRVGIAVQVALADLGSVKYVPAV